MIEMRRVWKNPGFWFSVSLGIFSMVYPHMDTHVFWESPLAYFASSDFLYNMLMPLTFGLAKLLLPFIAVLPAALFLAEDQKRRYHLMLYHRYGAWNYIRHRILLTVCSAVLAAALGLLIYAGFVAFACPWQDHMILSWRSLDGSAFDRWINEYEGLPFLLLNLLCLVLSSATWGLVGFSIACFTQNSGVVIGGTFLAHYSASRFFAGVLKQADWSPMVLQAPSVHYEGSIGMFMLKLLIWFGIASVLAICCGDWFIARIKE